MNADDRIELVQGKVERAKQCIADLNVAIQDFLKSNPYSIGTKRDPQTRRLVYYVTKVQPTPSTIPAIAGDAIQNIRSALDHLAYQLFLVGTNGEKGVGRRIYFPIDGSAENFKKNLSRRTEGIRQEAINAICTLEPYKEGKGGKLLVLHELNIIDKHRSLLTVGSAYRSFNIGAIATRLAQKPWKGIFPIPKFDEFIRPADRMCPLEVGDELWIDETNAEPDSNLQFRFDIAFNEPQVIASESIIETLEGFASLVSEVIFSFRPMLA